MNSFSTECRSWWECSDDELRAINLQRSNIVAQGHELHRHGGNQALIAFIFQSVNWLMASDY